MNSYRTILADPPWPWKTWSKKGRKKTPDRHYPLMTFDELKTLDVGQRWADPKGSVLFMWVQDGNLPGCLDVAKSWGYEYKTVAFTWVKLKKAHGSLTTAAYFFEPKTCAEQFYPFHLGMGRWTRNNPERCLIFTRGKFQKNKRYDIRELLFTPVREHSRKPDEQYDLIEALCPGPYLELFARPPHREGWDVWGLDAEEIKLDKPSF